MMNKRLRKRTLPQKAVDSAPRPLSSVSSWLGIITASSGILVALLYIAGRSFSAGYFGAMNIPEYHVAFSLWEYGTVAWLKILFLAAIILLSIGLIAFLSKFLADRLYLLWQIVFPQSSKKHITFQLPAGFKLIWLAFVLIGVGFGADAMLKTIEQVGQNSGRLVVLERSARVELTASTPMLLDGGIVETIPVQGGAETQRYVYSGYRLLTYNGGKYYLFREIDPVTCKPIQVYVVEISGEKQISLLAAESLKDQCLAEQEQPSANATMTAPVTPIP